MLEEYLEWANASCCHSSEGTVNSNDICVNAAVFCKKCLTKKIYSSKITFQVISRKCDDGTMPFWGTLQRAGGWCEPVWNRLRSLLPEQIS